MSSGAPRQARLSAAGESFDEVVLPHLDAAYRLARWLMGNEHDAEDVVQEASLRAFRYFRTFTGGNGRAWFLRIVRNTSGSWRGRRVHAPTDTFDEERHSGARAAVDPETLLLQSDAAAAIDHAIDDLPDRFRELLILRELEGLSYREMAEVMGIPLGTVMSGLSRARQQFRSAFNNQHVPSTAGGIRMKNSKTHEPEITSKILRIACVTALGMAFTLSLPRAAHAQTVTPPPVPPGLEVPAPNQAFLVGHAVGTQNYECQPSTHLGRVDWVLFTPQATLFDDQTAQIITHFFSPNPDEGGVFVRATWQDSRDTSTIWARGIASATVDADAIDWVKLQVVGKRPGPTGGNALSGSTFVQRLNTKGGLAPATGCEVLSDVGHKAFVPYTADYFFYRQ